MSTLDPTFMITGKAFWEHCRSVTEILWDFPSNGVCEMHGFVDHVCTMFTCSEDRYLSIDVSIDMPMLLSIYLYECRSLRVWSTSTYECIKIVDTKG